MLNYCMGTDILAPCSALCHWHASPISKGEKCEKTDETDQPKDRYRIADVGYHSYLAITATLSSYHRQHKQNPHGSAETTSVT